MEQTSPRKQLRRVSIRCEHCGDYDQINDRSFRRKVAEGRPHLCSVCRAVSTLTPDDTDTNWWRKRYSQAEIEALVASIL